MRIGILTGGGDCSALNAALHGVARTLMVAENATIVGIEDGFLGLLEQRTQEIKPGTLEGLMPQGGTILGTCNKATPFNYRGANRVAQVAEYYHSLELDAIVALGGDGTMAVCHELSAHGMAFVGVPKTIDNDLQGTDRSFGFDSAVSVVAQSVERLHTTGKSHHRVMIVETMGRYAGWIALYGGVAGDADVILLPEFPYDIEDVVSAVQQRERNHSHTVIVIAEGTMPMGGEQVISQTVNDSPDPIRLGGIGAFLQKQLQARVDSEIRTTVLGHVQRGGPPTAFDQMLANNLGCYAARLVLARQFGHMARVHNGVFGSIPLATVARGNRPVPETDITLAAAAWAGIRFGDPALVARLNQLSQGAALNLH